jgi:hypothetical protein
MSHSGSQHVHVGSPAAEFPMEDVKLVHFHDFKNLTATKGEAVESPEFECAGHKWKLKLYPGGSEHDGYVAVELLALFPSESSSEIKLKDLMINVKKIDGESYYSDWGRYEEESDIPFSLILTWRCLCWLHHLKPP